jgi:hypothetical protein
MVLMRNKNKKVGVTFSSVHHAISGIPFPSNRQDIIEYVRNAGSNDGVIDLVKFLPDHEYRNETEIINNLNIKYENTK